MEYKMKSSTAFLWYSWIPLSHLLLLRHEGGFYYDGKNISLVFGFILAAALAGLWSLKKEQPGGGIVANLRRLPFYTTFYGILLGTPVVYQVFRFFERLTGLDTGLYLYAGLVFGLFSALLSSTALYLAWQETPTAEKSWQPATKVYIAGFFAAWQLTMGLRFFVDMPLKYSYGGGAVFHMPIGSITFLAMARWVILVSYIVVILAYTGYLLVKLASGRRCGGRRSRLNSGSRGGMIPFFSVTGLVTITGTYLFIRLSISMVKLFPGWLNTLPGAVALSFIPVIDPLLTAALLFSITGILLALVTRDSYLRNIWVLRGMGLLLAIPALLFHFICFAKPWPLGSPAMDVLMGIVTPDMERETPFSQNSEVSLAFPAMWELPTYGKIPGQPIKWYLTSGNFQEKALAGDVFYYLQNQKMVEQVNRAYVAIIKTSAHPHRLKAFKKLKAFRYKPALTVFISLLKNAKDVEIRQAALEALKEFNKPSPQLFAVLIDALDDIEHEIRKNASTTLHYWHDYLKNIENMKKTTIIDTLNRRLKKSSSLRQKHEIRTLLQLITGRGQ
ncbi:MAG: HEAT repeat domain-containing protein [bacterium]|nr:HEAT repeat domain-containing protein [bacterium]